MGTTAEGNNDNDQGEARFRWRTLALWAVVVALVSLTALAVVATISGADTLSVVALALAVMAFVVQIIVFIVQGISSSQQAADAAELNAQTLRALATIEEKSEGTRETVGKMSDRMWEFAFTKASAEVETSRPSEPNRDATTDVLERAKEIIMSSQDNDFTVDEKPTASPQVSSARAAARYSYGSRSFLTRPLSLEELTETARLLGQLIDDELVDNELALSSLQRLGEDRLQAEMVDMPEQAGMSIVNMGREMHAKGLIKRVNTRWSNHPVFVLTDEGLLTAKALLMTPAPPNEVVLKARRIVEDFRASIEKDQETTRREYGDIPTEN